MSWVSADSATWFVVLPFRPGQHSKTRLTRPDRQALAEAMARDTAAAAAVAVANPAAVLTVTTEPRPLWVAQEGYGWVVDDSSGLDAAAARGAEYAWANGATGVAVLLADHPCLRPDDLLAVFDQAHGVPHGFVADRAGTGTALVTATAREPWRSAFGAGSAARHRDMGFVEFAAAAPGLLLDVDEEGDLVAALALGVGPHTRRLGYAQAMQATIHQVTETGGSALLDDGRQITWTLTSVASSSLRHLRPGQRVTVDLDEQTMVARHLWICGIGPEATIP